MNKIKVLLGGIGDDSHSIGSSLIKIALEENGYYVNYLGIHNSLDDFMDKCIDYDAIFISCINGHTELYINEKCKSIHKISEYNNKLWYLGGNLSVNKSDEFIIEKYTKYGFDRVFPKPISVENLLSFLSFDIKKDKIKSNEIIPQKRTPYKIDKDRLLEELEKDNQPTFFDLRKNVLHEWPTGTDVSNDRAYDNYNKINNVDEVLWGAEQSGNLVIQPRTGVAALESEINLLQALQNHGISIASIQLDAASRQKNFSKAKEGVEYSLKSGTSMLNGFPVPIYGVSGIEKLVKSLDIPFQIRGGAPDHCLVYEIGICGGATSVEGSFLSYLLPYQKNMHPINSIKYWDYIDKLCGMYFNEYGMVINREFFGPLTTTLIEPSIAIVINIIEMLFAAERGVKSFSVGIAEQGNRVQDIAAINVLKEQTDYYLKKYKHHDCRVTTVFHQYMGAFPNDVKKAEQLIFESAITAKLSKATRIMTKTPVEAIKIPSADDNIRGINIVKNGIEKAKTTSVNLKDIIRETNLIRNEVFSIMDYIENIDYKSIELKAVQAIQDGVLDIMFSPNCANQNKLICFRGVDGAVRIYNPQRLHLSNQSCEFHAEEFKKRIDIEKNKKIYSILSRDLTYISEGKYKRWPLDKK